MFRDRRPALQSPKEEVSFHQRSASLADRVQLYSSCRNRTATCHSVCRTNRQKPLHSLPYCLPCQPFELRSDMDGRRSFESLGCIKEHWLDHCREVAQS